MESSPCFPLAVIIRNGRSYVTALRYDLLVPPAADDSPDKGAPSFSLDIPSVHIIRTELNEGIQLVKERSRHETLPYPNREDLCPFRHGTKVQRFIDLSVRGVKVIVDLERQ